MRKLFLLLLIAPFMTVSAFAEGLSESAGAELDAYAVRDALPDDLQQIGGELSLAGDYDASGALERLWRRFLESLKDKLKEDGREAFCILAILFFCTLCAALTAGQKQAEYVQIAGCAAVAYLLAGGLNSVVRESLAALTQMSDYAKASLPVIYTAAAASGALASASSRYAVACFALDVMMTAAERVILPLICAYIAMAVCAAVFENPLLRGMLKISKRLAVLLMSGMTIAFTAFLSITGMVSGSADAAAIKATKTVISASLPVVGGIMSDAASSVISAAAVIRNSVGAFGMVAVCAICVAPFASLAVKRMLFSLVSAVAEMTAGGRLSRLLGDMAGVMSMLLGLVGSFSIMLFFSIVAAIRTVGL